MRRSRVLSTIALVLATLSLGAAPGAADEVGVPASLELTESSSMTIREPGTVIDGLHVRGSIHVRADNVTIIRSKVTNSGYHSIRIDPHVKGARVIDTTVECLRERTNGVVFGNYFADGVSLEGCRHDFMTSTRSPAVVVNSLVDGVPFSLNALDVETPPEVTPEPLPTPSEAVGVPDDLRLSPTSSMTIKEPGTVVDGAHVRGSIRVRADDVTIIRTKVTNGGYHSIRIDSDVKNTRIIDTTVECVRPRTNGVVFDNYFADGVALEGCRHDFMSSQSRPAVVINSSIDGEPFSLNAEVVTPTPEPTPEPEPTSEPEPEPKPEPSPEPEPALGPELDGFPDAQSTGVPAGVELTPSRSLVIEEDGAIVDGLHVRGTIRIEANDVTVRNTLVQGGGNLYPINVARGTTGTLIEHVELDNLGSTGIGILFAGSGIVRYANIHSAEDGIRVQADGVTVESSYIHDLQRQSGGHHDAIQIRRGDNVTIRGNNLQPYVASTRDPMNAAIQIGSLLGEDRISDLLVEGNLMNGGNHTINGGGRNEVESAVYRDNVFGRDYRYSVAGNIQNSVWESSNVWYDTGEPVR